MLLAGAVLGQGPGGVRRHNQELLPRAGLLLARAGGGLAVLTGRGGLGLTLDPPVEVLRSAVPAGPPLARALREGRALARVLAAARAAERPFDLVHTAHLPAPRGLTVPYTLMLHDLRALGSAFPRRVLAARVIGAAVARAAAVLSVSETVRAEVQARFRPRRSVLVPNAGDHLQVLPWNGSAGALLHVGHLEPRKNLGLLLEALALDPQLPDLELAGAEHRGERARLEARAARLGIMRRVRFLGPVADELLPELYARSAAVVLPSHLEGFGIVALEAQRAGVPLAIAAAGALPEVAGEGVPRFAPDDVAGCARAIRSALSEDEPTRRARARRAARYRWEMSASALVEAWTAAASG